MILRMDQEETDFQQTIYAINSFIKRAERRIKQREEHQARVVEAFYAGEWKQWLLLLVDCYKGHHLKLE